MSQKAGCPVQDSNNEDDSISKSSVSQCQTTDNGSSEEPFGKSLIVKDKSSLTFEDIIGLNEVKDQLLEIVVLPYKFPDLFKGIVFFL